MVSALDLESSGLGLKLPSTLCSAAFGRDSTHVY